MLLFTTVSGLTETETETEKYFTTEITLVWTERKNWRYWHWKTV